MRRTLKAVALALAIAAPAAGRLQAQNLGVSEASFFTQYGYGGSLTAFWTGALNTAFGGAGNVSVVPDLSGNLGLFSAILVDLRHYNSTFTATEATNLAAFIASGRRVMIFGENYSWTGWNSAIAAFVGGTNTANSGWVNGGTTIYNHQLTQGVSTVNPLAPGTMSGGTSLFDNPYANLWGANLNVLTLQDVNTCNNDVADNYQFCRNAADWLRQSAGDVVPEPFTVLLLGTGLLGVGGAGFLKRRKDAPKA